MNKNDYLFPIGSVVTVEDPDDQPGDYLIIGHRMINPYSMKAWDYVSVEHPKGLVRYFKHNSREIDHDDFFYFNHFDIEQIIHAAEVTFKASGEENDHESCD